LWIINNFFSESSNLAGIKNSFSSMEWSQEMVKGKFLEYGVIFDLFAVYLENILNIQNSHDVYHLKHFLNFFIFFISSIFFFYLIKFRFKNNFLALVGVLFYVTSPRIFAESFFNSKDIIFMSFVVIAIFFALKTLKKFKIKNIIFFALFSAFSTDVRSMGIFLLLLFSIFFILESIEIKDFFRKKIKFLLLTFLLYFLFTYAFWPYLWLDPINNFFVSFKSFKNYGWGGSIFYLGDYVSAQRLPWHYIPIWITVSNPIIYSLLIFSGIYIIFNKFFSNFLKISSDNLTQKIWNNYNEKVDFFILLFFLGPLIAVIVFNSTLYNGWRHLYFVYPSLIYLIVFSLNHILNIINKEISFNFLIIVIFFSIFINIFNIIKLHPYQNIYFNFLVEKKANDLFEIDYWGSGNAYAIKKILNEISDDEKISIRTGSFTPLKYSVHIVDNKKLKNVTFSGNEELNQNYFFTNYIYEKNPKSLKKYFIPKNYEKIFTLKRGNIIINEIYKKK